MDRKPGTRGVWHSHRVYRKCVGRPLVADMIDLGGDAVYENRRTLCHHDNYETSWDSVRNETLRRYFRRYNGGRCTVDQWNDAVDKYCRGYYFSGKGSKKVEEGITVFYTGRSRVSSKRLVDLNDPPDILGRLFDKSDVESRLEKFKSYLSAKKRAEAKKKPVNIKAVPSIKKPDRTVHTDAPWARFVRENSESAAHAIRARVQELLEPTIERHREEMDSAYLQALGQAFEEILEADREGAREEQRERVNATA